MESERLERFRDNCGYIEKAEEAQEFDENMCAAILSHLNHPDLDKYCLVDACYYDFSEIPHEIKDKNKIYRDAFLLYGITNNGEIISKWIDRYEFRRSIPHIKGK